MLWKSLVFGLAYAGFYRVVHRALKSATISRFSEALAPQLVGWGKFSSHS